MLKAFIEYKVFLNTAVQMSLYLHNLKKFILKGQLKLYGNEGKYEHKRLFKKQ